MDRRGGGLSARKALKAVIVLSPFLFLASCEKPAGEEDDEAELRELAFRSLTARTIGEWTSCLDPPLVKVLGNGDLQHFWKVKRTGEPPRREDIRIREIKVSGDGALVRIESEKIRLRKLFAVKRDGKWFETLLPTAEVHYGDAHARARIVSNESGACACLRAFVTAQKIFHRKAYYGTDVGSVYANPREGSGFRDLYEFGGPGAGGKRPHLIGREWAEATTPERAYGGYYFVDITGDETGPYDYAKQFGFCAVPAEHGKSGVHTFIIDAREKVYKKDTAGKPVMTWPNLAEGWEPFGRR